MGPIGGDTSTTVLGLPVATPVVVAPVAFLGMIHRDGEAPVARAATSAGSIFVLSTFSVTPVETIVEAATGPVWFLIHVYRDRAASEALVKRVEADPSRRQVTGPAQNGEGRVGRESIIRRGGPVADAPFRIRL